MQALTLRHPDVARAVADGTAYLWAESGDGGLYRIVGISADLWVRVCYGTEWMTASYCCHGDTIVYVLTPDEHPAAQQSMREWLAARRELYRVGDWRSALRCPLPLTA